MIVGRVESVRLDPKTYEAVVTLRMDNGYQFSKDTIAQILTSGLLGEVYIGLEAGGDPRDARRRRARREDAIGGRDREAHQPVPVRQGVKRTDPIHRTYAK